MYIRLEYSEGAGHFHFSALNEKGENTNGYVTLTSKIKSHQAELFCEQLRLKFSEYKIGDGQTYVSLARVTSEFLDFIAGELKSMREAMANSYQQRSRVYRKQ